jgi:type I restriction enzyme S subunit
MKKLLPEVCTIQYGFPFDSAKFSDSNGMPLIRIRDVVRGYSETYTTEAYKSEYIVHENDLLIGMDGEFNIAKWGKTPALLNQRVCRLAPKDSINKDYLFYFMPVALKRIEEKTPFVTVKHLSAKELNKIEIPVLSLEEQRKIAETLSKVDELIAFREQQLAKLDELVKARFVEMFGDPINNPMKWIVSKIEDIAAQEKNALKAGPFGSALKKEFYVRSGYKIYGQEQVICGDASFGDYYIDEEKYKELKNCAVQAGDILISLVGTYGKTLIMPDNYEAGIINPRLMKITLNKNKVTPIYFKYYFESNALKASMDANTHGGTMGILNLGIIRQMKIQVPPLSLQNQFAAFVEHVDQQKQTVQQSLEKLELMKKALMQEYFG